MVKLKQTLSKRSVQSGLVTAAIILILILIGPVGASPGQYNPQEYGYPPGPPSPGPPPPGPGDTTPPEFIKVRVTDITHNSANINWETDEESDSQVEYWSSPSLLTTLDPTLLTTHRVHLANLTAETTYYFKVISCDKCGNGSCSCEYNFTTLAPPPVPDTTPPVISNVSAIDISADSATINWETDEESNSQVEYWSSPHDVTPLDPAMVTDHSVHLSNLTPGTTYHYKVKSSDASGNLAVSAENTFTTLEAPAEPGIPPPTPKPISWWLIGGIIAGVVVIGLLVYFLWWRRRLVT